jgi:hypothetical protein
MLKTSEIPSPEERVTTSRHEMSGGIRQLAMIAMALGCEAALIPAKEEIVMLFEINMLCPFIAIATFISIVVIQFVYAQSSPTSYTVTASPRTIHWGHLSDFEYNVFFWKPLTFHRVLPPSCCLG